MNSEPNQLSPIEDREHHYDVLFRGELPYQPLPEDAEVGIAGLCRITHRKGPRIDSFNEHLAELPGIVEDILLKHDEAARSEGSAVFGFLNDEARKQVTDIVAIVFAQWEITHYRNKLDMLLPDSPNPPQALVVETAAAAAAASTGIPNLNVSKNTGDKKIIAGIIASWGPKFAEQWFDGTVLKQWMAQEGVAEEEQAGWLEVFTPGLLKRFANYYIANPLKALETVKHNLEEVLIDQNIAGRLNWSEAEASIVINPGLRKLLAVSYINDPLEGLEKIKYNLEEVLTDANIAGVLGLKEAEAARLISPAMRKRFAANNINKPLEACQQWVEGRLAVNPRADLALANRLSRSLRDDYGLSTP